MWLSVFCLCNTVTRQIPRAPACRAPVATRTHTSQSLEAHACAQRWALWLFSYHYSLATATNCSQTQCHCGLTLGFARDNTAKREKALKPPQNAPLRLAFTQHQQQDDGQHRCLYMLLLNCTSERISAFFRRIALAHTPCLLAPLIADDYHFSSADVALAPLIDDCRYLGG